MQVYCINYSSIIMHILHEHIILFNGSKLTRNVLESTGKFQTCVYVCVGVGEKYASTQILAMQCTVLYTYFYLRACKLIMVNHLHCNESLAIPTIVLKIKRISNQKTCQQHVFFKTRFKSFLASLKTTCASPQLGRCCLRVDEMLNCRLKHL
jgi:hypothetical protein